MLRFFPAPRRDLADPEESLRKLEICVRQSFPLGKMQGNDSSVPVLLHSLRQQFLRTTRYYRNWRSHLLQHSLHFVSFRNFNANFGNTRTLTAMLLRRNFEVQNKYQLLSILTTIVPFQYIFLSSSGQT